MDCSNNDLFEALFHPWRSAGELCRKRKARQRKPPAWTVSHVICLCHGHSSYSMSSHSKCTAWCALPEASDVDRRSYVDWGFRCRLRPSRLDIGKTEARHEKSSWRLSISGRHDARGRCESACLGMQPFGTQAPRRSILSTRSAMTSIAWLKQVPAGLRRYHGHPPKCVNSS